MFDSAEQKRLPFRPRNRNRSSLWGAILLLLLPLTACGYLYSGQWEDDPKNWERAWGVPKPDDVVMPHSYYWRSPHWTREEAYFFQFHWHENLFKQLLANNKMSPVRGTQKPAGYCSTKPAWFAPRTATHYESWACGAEPECWLFRDKDTKELFLYACQL